MSSEQELSFPRREFLIMSIMAGLGFTGGVITDEVIDRYHNPIEISDSLQRINEFAVCKKILTTYTNATSFLPSELNKPTTSQLKDFFTASVTDEPELKQTRYKIKDTTDKPINPLNTADEIPALTVEVTDILGDSNQFVNPKGRYINIQANFERDPKNTKKPVLFNPRQGKILERFAARNGTFSLAPFTTEEMKELYASFAVIPASFGNVWNKSEENINFGDRFEPIKGISKVVTFQNGQVYIAKVSELGQLQIEIRPGNKDK